MKMRLQQAFFNSSQGPQHREFQKEILQAMRVGVGVGPNTEADEKSAYNNVQVGVGQRNKFCKNIISVPLPRFMLG
ncbi:hypothetical protein [Staphylococcus aureus]|uniref:hypothetical protein n=1 Tax=Staphylococcus aureus TaxID=1280 RepID=UPI000453582A|nr:hypothetical protein [Staphylococcus aureus]EZV69589.1 hypothetical protein V077_01698 [Staphylococcus aureus 2010-60-6511-39]